MENRGRISSMSYFLYQREYTSSSWDEAFLYANQANDLAYEIGDSLRIVKSLRLKAQILRRLDRLDESIKTFEGALLIAKRHDIETGFGDEIKYILNGLAIAHTYLANYDMAMEIHFRIFGNKRKRR
jgi:tetratricopeptide (TPR) repeat protein